MFNGSVHLDLRPSVCMKWVNQAYSKSNKFPSAGPSFSSNNHSVISIWAITLQVCLGEHNIKEPEDTEQHIMSAWFICHPDYNSGTQDSDIALIKLSQPATLNSYVCSVALPTKCGTAGTMCQVSGWGAFVPATKAVSGICVSSFKFY